MYKSILVSIVFSLFLSSISFAQNVHSIQFNGGIVFPRSSSKGLSAIIQYNYSLNQKVSFYIYTGYSSWDKFNVVYIEELSIVQKQQYFHSYSSDSHILIPLYFGTKINFHTNKVFTSFLDFEIGYSHFSFNSYDNIREVNPTTGEVLSYYVDGSSKKEVNKNLFGLGVGIGFSHPLTKSLNITLSYKINSNFNAGEYGLFSAEGTYSTLFLGFNFSI
ncbi:hypothetical protein BMS3Abin04_00751 [bacterium BMS3Abin04]|nr:hypothetical protein BMS3Abin04_00751 [bacterium BMS3Abin04]